MVSILILKRAILFLLYFSTPSRYRKIKRKFTDNCQYHQLKISLNVFCFCFCLSVPLLFPVRLVGGNHRWEGTVEVLYKRNWGTVCDTSWDIRDANVTCRQLGFKGAEAAPLRSAFGLRSGRSWMDQVQCKGNESSLSECPHIGWGITDCNRNALASAVCYQQGKSRLVH